MGKINADEYMVIHDEELGVVYAARKNAIKTTTPKHAQAINKCLNDYLDGKMPEQDCQKLECYMEKSFEKCDDLPLASCPNLLEREVLHRMEIIIINDCNLRCKYCYAHGGNYDMKTQKMSAETAHIFLQKLLVGRYNRVEIVSFFGGEPTMCPDTIQEICNFFAENVKNGIFDEMPQFLMVSNGTLIDEKIAAMIHKYHIGVTISIDGPMEINDLNRVDIYGKGSFSKIVRGIELLNRVGSPPVLLEATYTMRHKELGYTWEGIRDYLREHFQTENVMIAGCSSGGIEDGLAYEDWDPHIQDLGKMPFPNIEFTAKRLAAKEINDIGCDVAYGSIALLPNGDIYPCHFFVNHGEFLIAKYDGDDFDFSNYEHVLSRFEEIHKLKYARCTECWAKTVCSSCSAQFLLQGEDEADIAATCHITKSQQAHLILKCAKMSCIEK
ncbi:MAG: radical SAM protein [Lachnospiraceae bacterium]|nr:radical SAM protein [Lachnospiraceae bacterium]